MKIKFFFFMLTTVLLIQTVSGSDIDINGDFKGGSGNDIPGWQLIRGSNMRRYQIKDDDDCGVELSALSKLRSKLVPALGNNIDIEAKVSGSGMGMISCVAFDRDGKELNISPETIRFSVNSRRGKIRASFPVAQQAHFVALCLESSSGSRICFEDVEAEFKPPWRNLKSSGTLLLADGRYYPLSGIGKLPFSTQLKPGKDIDFELQEKSSDRWQVVSFDSRICKVETEHDRDGVWPFYRYKFEVEIKALRTGKTDLILRSTSGQELTVKVTVAE